MLRKHKGINDGNIQMQEKDRNTVKQVIPVFYMKKSIKNEIRIKKAMLISISIDEGRFHQFTNIQEVGLF